MKKTKTQKGITLIALIITIIVLLILAVVSIREIQGDGIIAKAKQAATDYNQAQINEIDKMTEFESLILAQTGESTQTGNWVQDGTGTTTTFTKGEQTVTLGDIVNYTVSGYSGQWKVLGVENGQLLLVSASNVVSSLTLEGMADYNGGGVAKLNQACAPYKNEQYATEARSIKVEDINRITGYDPTKDDDYKDSYNKTTYIYEGTTYTSTFYYYSRPVISSMFSDSSFWLASPYVDAYGSSVSVGLRLVDDGGVYSAGLWNSYGGGSSDGVGVRAVVSLKSDIQLTRTDTTGPWNLE